MLLILDPVQVMIALLQELLTGSDGKVIGIDMTEQMIEKARKM